LDRHKQGVLLCVSLALHIPLTTQESSSAYNIQSHQLLWTVFKLKSVYSLRLSSSRSEQKIGRRVVSTWHNCWPYLKCHSSQHPVCPNLLSVCLVMSALVFQPSSCHLLVSILWPGCVQQIVFFWLLLCHLVQLVQIVPSHRHLWCGHAMKCLKCS